MSSEPLEEQHSELVTPPDGASGAATPAKPASTAELEEPLEGEFDAAWAVLETLTDPNI